MLCADCTAVVSNSRRDSTIWLRCCNSEMIAIKTSAASALASISRILPLKLSLFIETSVDLKTLRPGTPLVKAG